MDQVNFKDQLYYFKTRLSLILICLAGFLIGTGLVVWRWYQLSQASGVKTAGFQLERTKFDRLWQELTEKTVAVELSPEIGYGGEVGKLEPFE